jgi:hypothetical protein
LRTKPFIDRCVRPDEHGEDLLSLANIVKAQIIKEYGSETAPLDLVAITDGAKVIRQRLVTIFGTGVLVILDWYRLCKKLQGLMSMIAINKIEKSQHLKFLLLIVAGVRQRLL